MNELQLLIENFPDLHWRPDDREHHYRAYDRPTRTWHYAKFSDNSDRWAAISAAEDFVIDLGEQALTYIEDQLDKKLAHLIELAAGAATRPYDRSCVLAELSSETDIAVHEIERLLDTIDRLGIQPEDWRTP